MLRLWSGLRARIILTYLVVFLVSAAIMAGITGTLYERNALQTAEHDLDVQAFLMTSTLERPWMLRGGGDQEGLPPLAQLQTLAGRFAEGTAADFTVLDVGGNPLATSFSQQPGNQFNQPEVQAALRARVLHNVRRDPATGREMIWVAAPIGHEGRVAGVVQVGMPMSQVAARTRGFWITLALTALLAALGATLAGLVLAGQLVRPVDRLRDAAVALAGGDLDTRVPTEGTGGVREINQLADAFNYMAARIQETLVRQREFVANASHELRTPLTNIKLRAEALGDGALADPPVAQRFVGEIESEADRLTRMANDLLALSRQDAGTPAFREAINVGALVHEVVDGLALRADRQHIDLIGQVQPALPTITADPVGMRTVLVNLVDNALRYTPAGGRIVVCAKEEDGPAARRPFAGGDAHDGNEAPSAMSGPRIVLSVSDTGAGIPPEDLPRIFERFYRVDKARSRGLAQRGTAEGVHGGSGAGLGLAIVRGIVEEHGGAVSAESTAEVGTTVSVELPLLNRSTSNA